MKMPEIGGNTMRNHRKTTSFAIFLFVLFFVVIAGKARGAETLDPTCGSGGVVITDFGVGADSANSTLVQPDGKILVGGLATSTNEVFAVARYNIDGSLDSTFGTGGMVLTAFPGT